MNKSRFHRESYGFSQKELGEIIGASRVQVNRHERVLRSLPKSSTDIFARILVITDHLPAPDSIPDVPTHYLAASLVRQLASKSKKLEEIIAKNYRTLALMEEANKRIKYKLAILTQLMGEWPTTEGPRWKAFDRIATGLMRKLTSCGPERILKRKLYIETLESELVIVRKYQTSEILK